MRTLKEGWYTDNPPGSVGVPPAEQMSPEIPDESHLDPKFLVSQARQSRQQADHADGQRRLNRRAKGIAQKGSLAEHYDQYSRKIQGFVKFFLGNPEKPHDYPSTLTERELQDLYWIKKRSATIITELDRVQAALADKMPAEIDYYVSIAEKEIRKSMPQPPFTPAVLKGPGRGCKPVNIQTKAD
ncbi:hypothetical protein PTTG_09895, partial [Puccinia triticina 1-1 BBBD Race 1]